MKKLLRNGIMEKHNKYSVTVPDDNFMPTENDTELPKRKEQQNTDPSESLSEITAKEKEEEKNTQMKNNLESKVGDNNAGKRLTRHVQF